MAESVDGPPAFPADVDVAVVSHNGRETLPRVLACLARAGTPRDRIAIYDIGSTDDTVAWLAREWPEVTVRRIPGNVGPNPGRNWALRSAGRPYLLLLDADAFLHPDAPVRMRAALDPHARVGMVSPVTVDDSQQIQYAGVGLHFICEAINPYAGKPLSDRGLDRRDVGTAPGVALLLDVAASERIGLWDERYFLGKDDGDFCYRLRMAGYRLVEDPQAVAEHPSRPRSGWLFKYQIRNRWHFMLKNYEGRTLVVLFPALAVHEVLQFGVLMTKGHLGAWWQAVKEVTIWLPTLRVERRAIQGRRTVPDRDLLEHGPLLVRHDLIGNGPARFLKRAYDGWLGAYWAVASRLLS